MRIVTASDLHVSSHNITRCMALAKAMCEAEADVLVLGGDVTSGSAERYRKVLGLFAHFDGPKVLVAGNHDIWVDDPHPNTWRRYEEELLSIAAESGFHYLDSGPLVVGDTALIGCMGWYDYGMRQRVAPEFGLRYSLMRPVRDAEGAIHLDDRGLRKNVTWEELREHDYAAKGLQWTLDGQMHHVVWNDAVYVDWGRSDAEMSEYFAQKLQNQAEEIAGQTRAVVAVTHCAPFAEAFAEPGKRVAWAYSRAYMGSTRMGDVLRQIPNLRLAVYGHSHVPTTLSVGECAVVNASVAEKDTGPMMLEV